MLASIEAKMIAFAALSMLVIGGAWYYGHTRYEAGAAAVQAKWDAAKATQAAAAITASETARAIENRQANDFAGIASGYLQATTHAYPSIADALPAAVAAGAVQLRNDCPAASAGGGMSEAAARSRAADAAATQALADRTRAAIAAVRIGDAADKREADFRALILAQRALLTAERTTRGSP